MGTGAFVSLEDISSELPSYREEVIGVDMDEPLAKAYTDLEEQIKEALEEHRWQSFGNQHGVKRVAFVPGSAVRPGRPDRTEYDRSRIEECLSNRTDSGPSRGRNMQRSES